MHEVYYVHPPTAQWLADHGYIYQHEVYIPGAGRADFVAFHRTAFDVLIVECKKDCKDIGDAVDQVMGYRAQFDPSAKLAIAVPGRTVTVEALNLCRQADVKLITVETLWRPSSKRLSPNTAARKQLIEYIAAHPAARTMGVRELAKAAGVGKTTAAEVLKEMRRD